jgi:hypothetical protein
MHEQRWNRLDSSLRYARKNDSMFLEMDRRSEIILIPTWGNYILDKSTSSHLGCWRIVDKKIPQRSKRQINIAGRVLRSSGSSLTPEVVQALDVLGDWRTLHAYPLQCAYMKLREGSRRIDQKALVSQRLKRVPSILYKLQRNPSMALTTIQDIGGCRAILTDLKGVRKLAPRMGTIVKDYIANPKPDGYRGIHLVERYMPTSDKHEEHTGCKIEIQLRTRLQHAWATAVETVDSLLNQNIKGGAGQKEWRRFFALASSLIALKENSPSVPDCPSERSVLVKELQRVIGKLDVFAKLDGLSASIESLSKLQKNEGCAAYVLVLDMKERRISLTGFMKSHLEHVASHYLETEKEHFGDPRFQVVQVYVSQIKELKRAFPNYYLDTQAFVTFISEALIEKP